MKYDFIGTDKLIINTKIGFGTKFIIRCMFIYQAPVVPKVDNPIQRINRYPVDSIVCFANTYPLDSNLSGG